MMEYWKESLASAAEDCGLAITDEQLDFMAEAMKGSHECYGLYSGNDFIPNPCESQAKKRTRETKKRNKPETSMGQLNRAMQNMHNYRNCSRWMGKGY